jgi:TRAP transporter TAXI family solute receptor
MLGAETMAQPSMKRMRDPIGPDRAAASHRGDAAFPERLAKGRTPGDALSGRRARRTFTALAMGLLVAAWAGQAQAQEIRYFRIGTGAPETSYFPIGGVIASAVSNPPGARACDKGGSCGVPGLIALAQTTNGSIDNLNQIAAGSLDSGLCQANIAAAAANGKPPFDGDHAMPGLRAIANLYQEGVHVVVHADAKIDSVGDLKGLRVAIGENGSDAAVTSLLVLGAYGLTEKRIKPAYLSLADAAPKFVNGEIDAIIALGSYPVPAIVDLAGATPIKLVAIDDAKAEALRETAPYLTVDLIPAGAYQGVESTVTLGVGALWVVDENLDPELVYQLTRALWHSSTRRLLDQAGPVGQKIRLDAALLRLPIPLHPGAERYYAELGKAPTGSSN